MKYGFGDLVEHLDLPGKVLIERINRLDPRLNKWERARLAVEELGPTFIKIGQILSQRPDLVPPGLIRELQKLQEEVTPVDFASIRRVVEESLDCKLNEVFLSFDNVPLAAASLAQLHRAVLRDGNQLVAVKVQRPGIGQIIETDIRILEAIARRLNDGYETVRVYDLPGVVRELKRSLHRELDFTRELRNMKIFRKNFQGNTEIHIPQAYEKYCTEQVLTMEMVEGTKLKNFVTHAPEERELLARRGVRLTIKQVLEDGFFHADPHPGNVIILDGLVYCMLDFGMVGRLSPETRFDLIDMISAMVDMDSRKMLDSLLRISLPGGNTAPNQRYLEREVLDIIDAYHSVPLKRLNIGHLMLEIIALLRENGMLVPVDLSLMIKTLITVEGTARDLYPDLDLVEEAEPYVRRLTGERWKPGVIWKGIRRNLFYLFELQKQLPQKINHIVDMIDRGELNIRFHHENLGGLLHTLETITNRLTSAVIIAALVIGSSLMMSASGTGFSVLGGVGYIISGILGLWLVIKILLSR